MLKILRLILLCTLVWLSPSMPAWAQSPAWSCSGPYGGRILALAISPHFADDHMVLAGTDSGGLFQSADGGETWQEVVGLPADLTISSVATSPDFAKDRTLFVSTTQGGILKSLDGGETWDMWSSGLSSLSVMYMALSPAYDADQTLIAATSQGLCLSVSAGKRWLPVGPRVSALSAAIAPRRGDTFIAYGGTVVGLYVSRDSGQTWEPTALNSVPVIAIALSPDYANDQSILVGTLAGAYLSTDGGASWQRPWLEEQVIHHTLFSPDYANDQTLFVGGEDGVYVSSDSGDSWDLSGHIQSTVYALVAAPDYPATPILYAGTDQDGVFLSDDGGLTWAPRNNGITSLLMEAVAVSPNYYWDRTTFAGGPDGVWRSIDDGLSWQMTTLDYAGVNALRCSAHYAADQTVYAATNGGLFVSQDGGESWASTPDSPEVLNILDLALGPDGELWLATAEGGVYYSADGGVSWEPRSAGLDSLYVTAIEWLGTDGDSTHLVAGTWGMGTFVSSDGGLSWTAAASGPATPHIRDLACATGYGGRIWTFASTTAGLFRSGDLGNAWDFAGLLGQDISAVALHPNYVSRPNCYMGGRQDGVFRSLNGGLTWHPLNEGLGSLRVHGIAAANRGTSAVVYAATEGGVWRYGDAPQPEPLIAATVELPLVFR